MNNDLISREALKKAIEQGEGFSWDSHGKDDLCVCKKYIDNAPTITPTLQLEDITDEDIAKFVMIFQRATSKGVILESERSQGKWIFKHNSSDIWCSVCDENFDEIPQKFNYCPNCGADMRGEDHD